MRRNERSIGVLTWLLLALVAGTHVAAEEYYPLPESKGGWRQLSDPQEIRQRAGVDPRQLEQLKQWLLDSDQRDFAAVVIRRGYVVLEVERGNSAKTDSRRVASVSKAVCATVLGIASELSQQGKTPKKMTFDDRAFEFIPQAKPLSDSRKSDITVKQLLNHTSGITPEATAARNQGPWKHVLGHDGDPNTAKLAFDPGTNCGYSTFAIYHASLVCESVTGRPYDKFAIDALFKPIGCEHWWFQQFEGGGRQYGKHPSHAMGMPARDLARIAYCMLRDGRWIDQQVIPKWFVDETGQPTHSVKGNELRFKINAETFSHGWELPSRLTGEGGTASGRGIPRDARFKPGSGGQLIAFVPSLDLVVTRQTGGSGPWEYAEFLRRACAAVVSDRQPSNSAKPTSAVGRIESWQHHVNLQQESPYRDLKWRAVGPRKQGGRIETIACPPGNTSTMYVGAGSGGLWKTVNNGITWKPIFRNESTCAIGDVAVARSNPDVVWLGTGEVLMARSALAGTGVFKSTDAGETWKNMGLHDTHHIGRVLVDPTDEDVVYVAAIGHRSSANEQRGLFKTNNGGDSWDRVLYVNARTSAIDMVMDPSDRNILYVTTWQRDVTGQNHRGPHSGIYKSIDAGKTWNRLDGGLPHGESVGRIGIDVAASNPQVVYALVDEGKDDGLYRSDDAGDTWNKVNRQPVQAGWDWCEIRVSPDNEHELYNIGQRSFVSRDGGATFEKIGGVIVRLFPQLSRVLHLDTHAMWIDPLNTDRIVFGNDGGLFLSYDRAANWLHINNLPIAEVYAVTYDMEEPYNIYVGTQDNAALFGPSTHVPEDGGPDPWQQIYVDQWGGGDSYFTYRDPSDRDTIYYEHQYGDLQRKSMKTGNVKGIRPSHRRGQSKLRFAWMTPFFPSIHDLKTLYCGANQVFKSENRGDDWTVISPDLTVGDDPPNTRYQAITALAESPRQQGLLFAGTDNGNLSVSRDDGGKWEPINTGLPRYNVTRVTPSPHDRNRLFVTLTGMGSDDFSPYVFRSDDCGANWKCIADGLPLETVHVIREDPQVEGLLYIGTDLGVYVSPDAGVSWQSLCNNLPTAAVHDLVVHPRDSELVAGTHGLSVFVLDVSTIQRRVRQANAVSDDTP